MATPPDALTTTVTDEENNDLLQDWQSVNISVSGLEPALTGLQKIIAAKKQILVLTKTMLQIVSAVTSNAIDTASNIMLQAITGVEKTLDTFTGSDIKVHVLAVPPHRREAPAAPRTFSAPTDVGSWSLDSEISEETKKGLRDFMAKAQAWDGGNPGYVQTVLETLSDIYDVNRPTYDANSAIASLVLVGGADSLAGIRDIMRFLNGLFGATLRGNMYVNGEVGPQSLTATPIAALESASSKPSPIGIRLDWRNPTIVSTSTGRVRIDEIAVIQSTDPEVMRSETWGDLFGTSDPTALKKGENSLTSSLPKSANAKTEVIEVFRYNPVTSSYVVPRTYEKGKTYYFMLAFRTATGTVNSAGKVIWTQHSFSDTNLLSGFTRVRIPDTRIPSGAAPAPNWYTHPGVLELVPSLYQLIIIIKNFLGTLKNQTTGSADLLKDYLAYLEDEVTRYGDYGTQMTDALNNLSSILKPPSAGLYATFIMLEEGGMDAFIAELVGRMSNESDPLAPPFHKGGFVCGAVLLAGAPNPASLESFQTMVELITGVEAQATTAYESAVNSIDTELATLEATTFTTDPGEATFNDAGEPVDPSSAEANVPHDP
jgi:hypothetical protein